MYKLMGPINRSLNMQLYMFAKFALYYNVTLYLYRANIRILVQRLYIENRFTLNAFTDRYQWQA